NEPTMRGFFCRTRARTMPPAEQQGTTRASDRQAGSGGAKLRTVVRRREIKSGAEWQDASRVQMVHAAVIAALDFVEIDRRSHTRHLIDLPSIVRQIMVVG